jgi:hypothetical protein
MGNRIVVDEVFLAVLASAEKSQYSQELRNIFIYNRLETKPSLTGSKGITPSGKIWVCNNKPRGWD